MLVPAYNCVDLLNVPLRFFLPDQILTRLAGLSGSVATLSASFSGTTFARFFSWWLRNSFQQSDGFDVSRVREHVDRLNLDDAISGLRENLQIVAESLRVA